MQVSTITSITKHVVFVIGIIILVTGIMMGIKLVAEVAILGSFQGSNYYSCDFAPVKDPSGVDISEAQKRECLENQERSRKREFIDSLSGSLGGLIVGGALTLAFRPKQLFKI